MRGGGVDTGDKRYYEEVEGITATMSQLKGIRLIERPIVGKSRIVGQCAYILITDYTTDQSMSGLILVGPQSVKLSR